jgi:Domain of unknown function (DUF4326)
VIPTRVINVRGKTAEQLAAIPGFVYVGRALSFSPVPLIRAGSPFGNPFKVAAGLSLAGVLGFYRDHVRASPKLLALLPTLRGKVLGCWCCDDDRSGASATLCCHGQVLAELADGPLGEVRASKEAG